MFGPIVFKIGRLRPLLVAMTSMVALVSWGHAAHGQGASGAPRAISQDNLDEASKLYPGLNATVVADVAAALGFDTKVLQIEGQHPVVTMEDERGLRLVAEPMVCDGEVAGATCQALLLYAYFGGSPAMHNSLIYAANRYNEVQYFARGHVTSGSDAVVSRLVVGEHGITRGNLAAELFTMRIAVYNYARLVGVRNSETGQMMQSKGGAHEAASPPAGFGLARPFAAQSFVPGSRVSRWKRLGLFADYESDIEGLMAGLGLDPVSSPAD